MTPEKIITSATITTGEKHDGKELINLIEKSENNGIEVEAIIGDGAYSEKENLNYCNENEIKNVSKLSKMVTHGNSKKMMILNIIKMLECMFAKLDIWQFKKKAGK